LYYHGAAVLGWRISKESFARLLQNGQGCEKDLGQAVVWCAKAKADRFWVILTGVNGKAEYLGCDLDCLYYLLGWGLYWYLHGTRGWYRQVEEKKAFGNRCLNYYCCCIELQRESIFTFLWCWNKMTGVKGPGQMIARLVWKGREDSLVRPFCEEQRDGLK
jgi:hypothetical protein